MSEQQPKRPDWSPSLLGTLRSELDDSPELDWAFNVLESCAQSVRGAYTTRRITPHTAASILAQLRLEGTDGATWTIGATSGSWYRRTGKSWEHSEPPFDVLASGALPAWVESGVASAITAGEDHDQNQQAVQAVGEPVDDEPATPVTSSTSATPAAPGTASAEDFDWVLDEWAAATPVMPARPAPSVGNLGTTVDVPAAWDAGARVDASLSDLTTPTTPPVPRVGEGEYRDALDEDMETEVLYGGDDGKFNLPQSFFLPPETDK